MGLAESGARGHSWAPQGSCLPLIPSVWGRNGPRAPCGRFALAEDLTEPLAQSFPPPCSPYQEAVWPGPWPLPAFLPPSFLTMPFLFTQRTVPSVCLLVPFGILYTQLGQDTLAHRAMASLLWNALSEF